MKPLPFLRNLLKKLKRGLTKARRVIAQAVRGEAEHLVALLESEAGAEMARLAAEYPDDSAERGRLFREWMAQRLEEMASQGKLAWKDLRESLPSRIVNLAAEILYAAWRKKAAS